MQFKTSGPFNQYLVLDLPYNNYIIISSLVVNVKGNVYMLLLGGIASQNTYPIQD